MAVREQDSESRRSTLAFRDLLRARPAMAAEYARGKKSLAERFETERAAYQREKGRLIESLRALRAVE